MKKKTYDAAFKQEAIRLVEEQGEKTATVAKKLGVTNKTMYRWVSEYRQAGSAAFPGKGHLKPDNAELRRLKRENEELREENEILKKAAAIFAQHQR
jgi:Transposase and inactivated derivatives